MAPRDFGLTISSSWGNGHAALGAGSATHSVIGVTFFQRDVSYYSSHRDITALTCGRLVLYGSWNAVRGAAESALADADAGLVTPYCPDARAATDLLVEAACLRGFYDLDAPVTLPPGARLLLDVARARPDRRYLVGGSQ